MLPLIPMLALLFAAPTKPETIYYSFNLPTRDYTAFDYWTGEPYPPDERIRRRTNGVIDPPPAPPMMFDSERRDERIPNFPIRWRR